MTENTIYVIAKINPNTGTVLGYYSMIFPSGFDARGYDSTINAAIVWVSGPNRAVAMEALKGLLQQPEWAWLRAKLSPNDGVAQFSPKHGL